MHVPQFLIPPQLDAQFPNTLITVSLNEYVVGSIKVLDWVVVEENAGDAGGDITW
jgi:hypothetical protein